MIVSVLPEEYPWTTKSFSLWVRLFLRTIGVVSPSESWPSVEHSTFFFLSCRFITVCFFIFEYFVSAFFFLWGSLSLQEPGFIDLVPFSTWKVLHKIRFQHDDTPRIWTVLEVSLLRVLYDFKPQANTVSQHLHNARTWVEIFHSNPIPPKSLFINVHIVTTQTNVERYKEV